MGAHPTPAFLAAAGIQSPFPIQPGACLLEWSKWYVELCTGGVIVGTTVSVQDQGPGFPLRETFA